MDNPYINVKKTLKINIKAKLTYLQSLNIEHQSG